MTIADRIRTRREELQLSQEELAKRCGYADKTSISKIENSGDNVTLKKIKRIADALGVSHHYLMGWESVPTPVSGHGYNVVEVQVENSQSAETLNNNMSERATRLYDLYLQAPPEIQAAVETLLKATKSDS